MSDPPAEEIAEPTAAATTSVEKRVAGVFDGNDKWLLVAAGICVAGAVYPIVVVGMFAMFGLIVEGFRALQRPSSDLVPQLFAVVPAAVFVTGIAAAAGCVGAIWAGFLSVIVVPIFYLFARSLQLRASIIWLGAMCGGLVGFVGVLPFLLNGPLGGSSGLGEFLIVAAVGPCLTTILGQFGGAWGGKQAQRNREKTIEYHLTCDETGGPMLQFQIRHLLWVTVWLSLLLTAIRLSGIPFELILPVLLAWLVYQAATLYCGWLFVRRVLPWWSAWRVSRST